jgi:hypothetical protein
MSEQKVPLPEPVIRPFVGADPFYFTEEQIQSYGDAREQAGWNAAIEWAKQRIGEVIGGVPAACNPPGQPGSYARGHHNGMVDCLAALREGRK